MRETIFVYSNWKVIGKRNVNRLAADFVADPFLN